MRIFCPSCRSMAACRTATSTARIGSKIPLHRHYLAMLCDEERRLMLQAMILLFFNLKASRGQSLIPSLAHLLFRVLGRLAVVGVGPLAGHRVVQSVSPLFSPFLPSIPVFVPTIGAVSPGNGQDRPALDGPFCSLPVDGSRIVATDGCIDFNAGVLSADRFWPHGARWPSTTVAGALNPRLAMIRSALPLTSGHAATRASDHYPPHILFPFFKKR